MKATHAAAIEEIERRGLLYPVTVIEGRPIYDGSVSYPGIMAAVRRLLEESEEPVE